MQGLQYPESRRGLERSPRTPNRQNSLYFELQIFFKSKKSKNNMDGELNPIKTTCPSPFRSDAFTFWPPYYLNLFCQVDNIVARPQELLVFKHNYLFNIIVTTFCTQLVGSLNFCFATVTMSSRQEHVLSLDLGTVA